MNVLLQRNYIDVYTIESKGKKHLNFKILSSIGGYMWVRVQIRYKTWNLNQRVLINILNEHVRWRKMRNEDKVV